MRFKDLASQEAVNVVAELRLRKGQLEEERKRIMENFERARAGDFKSLPRANASSLRTAKAILSPDQHHFLSEQEDRINYMKAQQGNIYQSEYIPPDKDIVEYQRDKPVKFMEEAVRTAHRIEESNQDPQVVREQLGVVKTQIDKYSFQNQI